MKQILQVLDPSHSDWVQGGVFRDIRATSKSFGSEPIYIPPPRSIHSFFVWIFRSLQIFTSDYVLFSSLTPLENYGRFLFKRQGQVLGVWFTHQEFEFRKFERRQLRRCNFIFVHSEATKKWLQIEFPDARIIRFVGAIDPKRFKRPAAIGEKVAWVGTPNSRKNPHHLFAIAKAAPDLSFRILGKNWENSPYFESMKSLPNVDYVEISGALSSSDFDGCRFYLMLSEIEGGPMPLLESLAAGLIPICTRTGFVEDLLLPLNLECNIIDNFDTSQILLQFKDPAKLITDVSNYIDFAKQFDFVRLTKLISGAYFD